MFNNNKMDRLLDNLETQLRNLNNKTLSAQDFVTFSKEFNLETVRALKESYETAINILKNENDKLKQDNDRLLDRLMSSYTPDALHTYKQVQAYDKELKQPEDQTNPFSILDKMEASTEDEKKQKNEARSQIAQLMGNNLG